MVMYVTKEELPPTPEAAPEDVNGGDPFSYYTNSIITSSSSSSNRGKRDRAGVFKYILVGAAFICLFFGASRSGLLNEMFALPLGFETGMLTSNTGTFTIVVESPNYGATKSTTVLPWDAMAEPFKLQTISLTTLVIDGTKVDVNDYSIEWDLGNENVVSGSQTEFQIDEVGVYTCAVTATNSATSTKYTQDFTLAVKYVRREIRTLTDEDREKFFEALYKIYTVDATAGNKMYGARFHTAEYFLWKHLTGAGTADCDHWHDGAGLVNNHVALTLEVEQSLQAVDPSISMPYWEYGMDNYLYKDWMSSPVFSADWFGEANPRNDLHAINDGGRWTNLAMPDGAPYKEWSMKETGTINPYINAYGHMRSPWNNNPSQLMGRHNLTYHRSIFTIPDCMTLQECFMSTGMSDINFCLNGATHGPVHINIGGAWAEGNVFDNGDLDIIRNPNRLLYFKVLWRMGYTRCPETCEADPTLTSEENHEFCKCSVPDEYIQKYGAKYILEDSDLLAKVAKKFQNVIGDDDPKYETFLRAIEDPGVAGEMFTSAASFDPTFWPLHGAMERLLNLKRIYVSQKEDLVFDETYGWPEYNPSDPAAYLYGSCDWSGVNGVSDLTLPACEKGTICEGHNAGDTINFGDFQGKGEKYTNAEFMSFIHPWNDDLPYTYDTFDFDYCADAGYPFSAYKSLDEVMAATSSHSAPPGKSSSSSSSSSSSAGGAGGAGGAKGGGGGALMTSAKPAPHR